MDTKFKRAVMPVAVLLACAASPARAEWITSWATASQPPMPQADFVPASPSFQNRTLRQVMRVSAGGARVRVRFSNSYGAKSLTIGGARIAVLDKDGQEISGSSRVLSFGGERSATAAKSAPLLSDPVALDIPALAKVAITVYLPNDTGPCTCHQMALDDTEVSPPGNFTAIPFKRETVIGAWAFLASIEVDAGNAAGTIAVLGDSISDGMGSTPKANRRWTDILAERLAERGGRAWGVANQGINANRVLTDGAGESALARLDRDVLSLAGVKRLILFEGVNDLGMSFGRADGPLGRFLAMMPDRRVSAAQVIAGYRQIIERARARGIKVYGATITPFKGATYWSPEGEAARQEVNRFIRSGAFDAVLDFDKVMADPADPQSIRAGFHMGDHLHGSDAGYKAMGESVDLGLFDR